MLQASVELESTQFDQVNEGLLSFCFEAGVSLLLLFTVRLCEAYTHGTAVDVCLSVRLSNACIVTKRKHLAKKVQL